MLPLYLLLIAIYSFTFMFQPPVPPSSGEELYYDDATRALIELANEARNKHKVNQDEKRKVESEIRFGFYLFIYDCIKLL